LAPLYGSDRFPSQRGLFYFQASDGSVTLPVAGYNYNSVWTPLLTGLSPAGMAASLAALVRPCVARRFANLAVSGLASRYPTFVWSAAIMDWPIASFRRRQHFGSLSERSGSWPEVKVR